MGLPRVFCRLPPAPTLHSPLSLSSFPRLLFPLAMSEFANTLIEWFTHNGRELPWRGTRDPYIIWVSEIILQQTRVAQGHDYFLRFVRRFPDVESLARASEDEVMNYWQGLGYYSRARHLHQAAIRMNGRFPTTYDEVRALPGVGDYTAAAICSMAYDMPCAVVDGNVYRVLSRYLNIDTPIDTSEGKKLFARLSDELMDRHRPSAYNQAVMDFGATVCTPRAPLCGSCPLTETCEARRLRTVDRLPVKARHVKVSDRYLNYFFIRAGEFTFIRKRTGDDIWKNLYELPMMETETSVSPEEIFTMFPPELHDVFRRASVIKTVVAEAKHVLTHRVLHAGLYEVVVDDDSLCVDGYLKINIDDLDRYAFPVLLQRFLKKICESRR